ncbi:MAG: twin-arginine translocation signal domain-containing protein, partial [Rhizobiaceae bacterium]
MQYLTEKFAGSAIVADSGLTIHNVSRRGFLKTSAAGFALAAFTGTAA